LPISRLELPGEPVLAEHVIDCDAMVGMAFFDLA
jgi:hypothetical protein